MRFKHLTIICYVNKAPVYKLNVEVKFKFSRKNECVKREELFIYAKMNKKTDKSA